MTSNIAIAIHGGSGVIPKSGMTSDLHYYFEKCLKKALYAGLIILQNKGSAIDAVQAAVVELEDCPEFNAGKGSAFNRYGAHEMDAAIMDGATLRAGAVGAIQYVRNPVLLARTVMDNTDYVLITGENALRLAQEQRLAFEPRDYFFTAHRHREWLDLAAKKKMTAAQKSGTVGAVALDTKGHLAAATSTGGMANKAYSRLSDSCIIGSGTYANDATCAVSCTGEGEPFIRSVTAYDIAALIAYKGTSLRVKIRPAR